MPTPSIDTSRLLRFTVPKSKNFKTIVRTRTASDTAPKNIYAYFISSPIVFILYVSTRFLLFRQRKISLSAAPFAETITPSAHKQQFVFRGYR